MKRDLPDSLLAAIDGASLDHWLAQAREAVAYVDSAWIVRYCNDVYLSNLGLSREQVVGRTPFDYEPAFGRSIFYETIETSRREARPMATIGYSTMLERWLMVRVFPVDGGTLLLANDASETVVKQYQLARQALRDMLTGLPNKLALVHEAERRLAAGETFSLQVLGVNRFKTVNDAQGYAQGDLALLEIASRLQSSTIAGETLYRLNGDEFALLADDDIPTDERLQRVLATTRQPIALNGQSFVLGFAAGTVHAPAHGDDAELLLKRAALALRRAKQTAQDGASVVYEPALERAIQRRVQMESELRAAVETGAFTLELQPKGSLTRRELVGAEALLRWVHPERGRIAPGEFLPLAQESGLMPAIDRWVLGEALRLVGELQARGLAVPVSINLSVDSLADIGFAECVREALARTAIEPSLLEIEIPEGALMRDVATSAEVLTQLNRLGVTISIDDFGTGYSSFAYLARFPVDTLKVDRSFVAQMGASSASRTIVKSLIRLAHALSLRVVAEGAETDEQMAMLEQMRCDEVQGYAYGRPMPFERFCEFARERREPSGPNAFAI
jgi:diguanylate cyclase